MASKSLCRSAHGYDKKQFLLNGLLAPFFHFGFLGSAFRVARFSCAPMVFS
jgi:hypothetical protein